MSTVVILDMQVKPEAVDSVKVLLKGLLPDTRNYDGCQSIDIYDNLDKRGNLVFYEVWLSRGHYERYLNWRTETGVLDQLGSNLTGPPSIRYFERVDV